MGIANGLKNKWGQVRQMRSFTILVVLVVLFIAASLMSPSFLKPSNLINIIRQISINGVLAIGMTFVLLTGGIDLSVGAVMGCVAVVVASLLKRGISPLLAIVVALIIGLIIGFINGIGVSKLGITAFIMTLGTQTTFRGVAMYLANGSPISWRDSGVDFKFLGQSDLLGIPVPVFVFLIVFVVAHIILRYTYFGRSVYAIGDSRETARLSGINIVKSEVQVYMLCGFLAALSALVLLSRLSVGEPQSGEGAELDAIAMSVIGGTSTAGGVGGVVGTFIGAALLSVVSILLNIMGVSPFIQKIVKGLIILFAVIMDRGGKRKSA